jgi:hypothetical protein
LVCTQKKINRFTQKIIAHRKHGSGCVYCVSNLALGNDLRTACLDYKNIYNHPSLNWDTIMYKKLQYISQGNTVETGGITYKTLAVGCAGYNWNKNTTDLITLAKVKEICAAIRLL